jgi:hypothetical protein
VLCGGGCGGFETKHLTICKVLFLTTFQHFCTVKEEECSTKGMAWPIIVPCDKKKVCHWIVTIDIRGKQTDGNR